MPTQEAKLSGDRAVQVFMREALPESLGIHPVHWSADLIKTTLSAVGKRFSELSRTAAEIEAYAEAMADMFCAYLAGLDNG